MGKTKKMFSLLIVVMILIFIVPLHSVAFAAESGAKTAPPPAEMGTMGAFDPNHQYLEDGYSIFSDLGNGDIKISGITKAKSYVDEIGVKIGLQKWTGTDWNQIYTSPSYTDTNARLFEAYAYLNVETGYYYRIVSSHWAKEGNVYEQGNVPGNYVLVNN